jgi:competence protein ComGC
MKRDVKGCTLIEMLIIMAIIAAVIAGALTFYTKTKEALQAQEKRYVKELMIAGGNPYSIKNIPSRNIEGYIKEITKENEIAVAAGKEKLIAAESNYVNTIQESVTPPVAQPVIVAATPAPVIEQVTENHYHFEKLTTVLKYMGLGVLCLISLFGLFKLMIYAKQTFIVKGAVRNSKKIVDNFDTNFDENKNYLPFLRNLSDQVIINSVLIENRKNKDSVLNLIVNNEQLKTRLSLIESTLMSKAA